MTLYLDNHNDEWELGMDFSIQGSGTPTPISCPLPDVSNVFRDHQWHMVTVTRDSSGMGRLYLDGSTVMINLGGGKGRVTSLSMNFPVLNFSNGNHDLYIGADVNG